MSFDRSDNLIEKFKRRLQKSNDLRFLEPTGLNFIYLMYDRVKGLYKIGFSKNPNYREKTLRSEEPDIQLFKKWFTPQKYESDLKKRFKAKRIRGEWFNLNTEDLSEIDKIMSKFSDSWETALSNSLFKVISNWNIVPKPEI